MKHLLAEALVMVALLTVALLTLIAGALSLFLLSAFIGTGGREAGQPLLAALGATGLGGVLVVGLARLARRIARER